MNPKNFAVPLANFTGIVILIVIIALPFLVANRIVKVAGLKTSVSYLISSQIQYFPNVSFSQEGQIYNLTYSKIAPSQFFKSLLILTNPTGSTQNYTLVTLNGQGQLFFGEDLDNQIIKIALPSGASTPISLFAIDLNNSQDAKLDFSIKVN